MTVLGVDRHKRRLRNLRENTDRLSRALFVGADMITKEAQHSITAGSISGKGHVVSAPGEPPNRDTGHLDTNIETNLLGPLKAESRSKAAYSVPLEKGSSKMAARPFMAPAVRKKKDEILRLLGQSVKLIIKES